MSPAGDSANTQGEPDYGAIEMPDPDEVPHEEWTYAQRRAYIYAEWLDRGTHQLINKSQVARMFDVTRDTIYNDMDHVAQFVDENMGRHHGAESTATFKAAVRELLNEGEYKDAAQVQNMLSDWLERRGAIDKEPDRAEVDVGMGDEDLEWLNEVF